jgi:hypothetical protein
LLLAGRWAPCLAHAVTSWLLPLLPMICRAAEAAALPSVMCVRRASVHCCGCPLNNHQPIRLCCCCIRKPGWRLSFCATVTQLERAAPRHASNGMGMCCALCTLPSHVIRPTAGTVFDCSMPQVWASA